MARSRGKIGNTSPNKRAVITTGTGPRRVKVLRALDPMTYKTQQRAAPGAVTEALNNPQVTKNQVLQRGKQLLRGKRQNVRRLFRRDPYNLWSATAPAPFGNNAPTQATFAPEAATTDPLNPNPSFHPEKAAPTPGSVKIVRQPQATPGRKNRGTEFTPNRFTLFGGKRLKRR